ncbi:GTPase Era [Cellvibrio japonicus]|uniref:GTPase Era n=1 Tax=Cellvibrio japonicus (strain Ueda107) TaxID=498211 RepID=B3PL66_CELJU|nr:GTPase Era [Cellvibrio japonicus]ACE82771.1 GTP-binding protein Era [Cellvibrio japonicus Ueda107]QEI12953.1 GTPase Era [Cellvibrio japonicus]QEI16527.1 GTPase Era [Cellvibrio japonicus]QEI20105.1 GTPase Era [Cellvibrio japonicus]
MSSDSPVLNGRCGYVAIVGRPNVGKSTLLNHLLGQKISITSRKPQTTRNAVVGIKTEGDVQIIFVDTPGLHLGQQKAINRYMNRAASTAMKDVDVVVFVVDRFIWNEEDDAVAQRLSQVKSPIILAVNKVDQIEDKDSLLPHLQALSEKLNVAEIVPISALRNANLERLEALIVERLPEGVHMYPEDQITDRSSRFMAAEIVREKITRQLGDELPYEMAVEIEEFKQEGSLLNISALILVEKPGQKKILIGDKGERIKLIGTQARLDMEKLFEMKIMLKLWVKIKSGWSDDERALRSLGYNDF